MTFLELCRNKAFWAMDAVKGGKIKKAYELIEKCDKGIWSEEDITAYQQQALEKLLIHTKDTVSAYKNQTSTNLADWPVVRKIDLKDNLDAHISSDYNKDDLIIMSTSGSTGTPFRCYQDVDKKRHVNAEVLYYNGLVGFKIGRCIIYFRSIVGEVSKSRLTQFLQNIRLIDCHNLGDEGVRQKIKEIRKCSKRVGGMVLSYTSTLDAYRRYFQKFGIDEVKDCKLYGIVAGSEMLHDITRDTLQQAFNCKVVSRYSNEENGFLGQDDIDRNVFVVNKADYYFEILKLDSDEPVADGEVGRIVITDLYNYAMPFVRYDTGDVGAWVETTHFSKKVKGIGNFGGRVVDMIFDTKGNQVSPHTITNTMWEFQGIKQYQFIQKALKEYHIVLNLDVQKFDKEQELVEIVRQRMGADAIITVEYKDEIPVLASGKRRYIVNEMMSK